MKLLIPGAVGLGVAAFLFGGKKPKTYELKYSLARVQGETAEAISSEILEWLGEHGEIHHWSWDGMLVQATWTPNRKDFTPGERKAKLWDDLKRSDFGVYLTEQTERKK